MIAKTAIVFLAILPISIEAKRPLERLWGIMRFDTPGDSVLLAGNSQLTLEKMCYLPVKSNRSAIELDWSDNGFIAIFFFANLKALVVTERGDSLFVKSKTTGPGKASSGAMGGDIHIKVITKRITTIIWRDDRDEIDFDLTVGRDRAYVRNKHFMDGYVNRDPKVNRPRSYVVVRPKKPFGTCQSIWL